MIKKQRIINDAQNINNKNSLVPTTAMRCYGRKLKNHSQMKMENKKIHAAKNNWNRSSASEKLLAKQLSDNKYLIFIQTERREIDKKKELEKTPFLRKILPSSAKKNVINIQKKHNHNYHNLLVILPPSIFALFLYRYFYYIFFVWRHEFPVFFAVFAESLSGSFVWCNFNIYVYFFIYTNGKGSHFFFSYLFSQIISLSFHWGWHFWWYLLEPGLQVRNVWSPSKLYVP